MKLKETILAAGFGITITLVLFLTGFPILSVTFFAIGFLLGVGFLYADAYFFVHWYQLPQPVSKSFLFLLIFVPATIFMFTSSSSIVGAGLILGIGFLRFFELFGVYMTLRKMEYSSKGSAVAFLQTQLTEAELSDPELMGSQTTQAESFQGSQSQKLKLSSQVLSGGKEPFTVKELQMITLMLGGLLAILLLKVFLV